MLKRLLGCGHKNTSRVFTDMKTKEKYVVCFDCSKRIPYDWNKMKKEGKADELRVSKSWG